MAGYKGNIQNQYFSFLLFFLNQQQTIRKLNCKMILFTRTRKTCVKHSGINLTSNLLGLHDGNYKCFINDFKKAPEKWEMHHGEPKALVWSSPRDKCVWTPVGFHNNQEGGGSAGETSMQQGLRMVPRARRLLCNPKDLPLDAELTGGWVSQEASATPVCLGEDGKWQQEDLSKCMGQHTAFFPRE